MKIERIKKKNENRILMIKNFFNRKNCFSMKPPPYFLLFIKKNMEGIRSVRRLAYRLYRSPLCLQ